MTKTKWYVYRAINYNWGEVYFGVSLDPTKRRDSSHCVGYTKALKHWNCKEDRIVWKLCSKHLSQKKASKIAHSLEKNYIHPQGFDVIQTAGI